MMQKGQWKKWSGIHLDWYLNEDANNTHHRLWSKIYQWKRDYHRKSRKNAHAYRLKGL